MWLFRWLHNRLRAVFGRRCLGWQGEAAAADYLLRLGYRIVAQRLRSQLGEVDLVALDGQTIVFVEVKTRQHAGQGQPGEAVDLEKRRRLTRLARAFLKRRGLLGRPARFDVIAVIWPQGTSRPQIEHLPNAFEATGRESFF